MLKTDTKPRRNFVISGGASHGATLWGSVTAALSLFSAVGFAGASIGAVIAAGLALGIDRNLLEAELVGLFQKNRLTGGAKLLRFHPRVLWSRGGGLHDWSHVVAALKRIFGDAKMGDAKVPLHIVVGDVYLGQPRIISSETHPEVLVWQVLAASTAIAPIADAQTIPSLGTGNRLYVDGGWGNNVPVSVFAGEPDPSVVIFLSKSNGPDPEVTKREGVFGVVLACFEMALYADPDIPARHDDLLLPIVPEGSGLDFDLSANEIRKRVLHGAKQAYRGLK